MAQIPFFELTAENAEASQMIHVVNRLVAEINKVIGPLPDPPAVEPAPPGGDTGATGATGAAVHTAPVHPAAHPNQRGTHR